MKGFKEFLMRGNLMDLAIAVIIGGAFGAVVSTFTDVVLSVIGLIGGNPDFSTVRLGPILVGPFINAVVSFVIIAAIVYFGILKPLEAAQKLRKKEAAEEEPAGPSSEELLTEIRDLLKAQADDGRPRLQ
ncbi:MAG: large conductance mechanosensitive channel protein MscL [Propionibacteriaceae bacterium]|nr:large conductance mechanosensitive channel protein MscL [Propionibacteriaceae bacterium]